MFDVVNVVQMNLNHLNVSLIKSLSIVFHELCMYKNEIFIVKFCVLQSKRVILLGCLHSES